MTVQNLAIVFGPTLFGMPLAAVKGQLNGGGMADTAYQNKVCFTAKLFTSGGSHRG
jgi:hypothetical protein